MHVGEEGAEGVAWLFVTSVQSAYRDARGRGLPVNGVSKMRKLDVCPKLYCRKAH